MTREDKMFVLANDCLTGDPLMHDLSLNQVVCLFGVKHIFMLFSFMLNYLNFCMQETNSICSNGCRIAKCMKEYFIYKKSYRSAINSMLLGKCLDQKLWETSSLLLKQLPGIGIVTAKVINS
jgi:ATP-dependent DNA helicase HFM1/MER3